MKYKPKPIESKIEQMIAIFKEIRDNIGKPSKFCFKCVRIYPNSYNYCPYHKDPKIPLVNLTEHYSTNEQFVIKQLFTYFIEHPEVLITLAHEPAQNSVMNRVFLGLYKFSDVLYDELQAKDIDPNTVTEDEIIEHTDFEKLFTITFGDLKNRD